METLFDEEVDGLLANDVPRGSPATRQITAVLSDEQVQPTPGSRALRVYLHCTCMRASACACQFVPTWEARPAH